MDDTVWGRDMSRLVEQQTRAMRAVVPQLERLLQTHRLELAKLEARAEELNARKEDPVVVYARRFAGPAPRYHSETNPCGMVERIEYPERVLLGDAIARGIAPCRFCGPRS